MTAAVEEPLSVQQEFLYLFDKGDGAGPFGPRYHIVDGWRVTGALDVSVLRAALTDLVARHEALRTVVRRGPDGLRQVVEPVTAPRLTVVDLVPDPDRSRDLRVEDLLNDVAAQTVDVHSLPLVRAVLGRFVEDSGETGDAVLVLLAHHMAADAWSMQLLARDLHALYAARVAGTPPPSRALQYRDYAREQRAATTVGERAHRYWAERLSGRQALVLPTDRDRSRSPEFSTSWYRFVLDDEAGVGRPRLGDAASRAAARRRCSPFMLLLAVFSEFARELVGSADVVVPTFTPGRWDARYHEVVGSFFNCLPVRVDGQAAASFDDLLAATRSACLGAYGHEVPLMRLLEVVPRLMAGNRADGWAPVVLQVIQSPDTTGGDVRGGVRFSPVRRKVLSQEQGSDIPDGLLVCLELDASGDLMGEVGYSTNLFDRATVVAMVERYAALLRRLLEAPDAPLPR